VLPNETTGPKSWWSWKFGWVRKLHALHHLHIEIFSLKEKVKFSIPGIENLIEK